MSWCEWRVMNGYEDDVDDEEEEAEHCVTVSHSFHSNGREEARDIQFTTLCQTHILSLLFSSPSLSDIPLLVSQSVSHPPATLRHPLRLLPSWPLRYIVVRPPPPPIELWICMGDWTGLVYFLNTLYVPLKAPILPPCHSSSVSLLCPPAASLLARSFSSFIFK